MDVRLVAATNQWIDLKSGALYDLGPSVLLIEVIAADYCSRSTRPNFEAFYCDIFEYNKDFCIYVHTAIGYSLTGSIKEQCFFSLIDVGVNGKSKFYNFINNLLEDYSKAAAYETPIAKCSTLLVMTW